MWPGSRPLTDAPRPKRNTRRNSGGDLRSIGPAGRNIINRIFLARASSVRCCATDRINQIANDTSTPSKDLSPTKQTATTGLLLRHLPETNRRSGRRRRFDGERGRSSSSVKQRKPAGTVAFRRRSESPGSTGLRRDGGPSRDAPLLSGRRPADYVTGIPSPSQRQSGFTCTMTTSPSGSATSRSRRSATTAHLRGPRGPAWRDRLARGRRGTPHAQRTPRHPIAPQRSQADLFPGGGPTLDLLAQKAACRYSYGPRWRGPRRVDPWRRRSEAVAHSCPSYLSFRRIEVDDLSSHTVKTQAISVYRKLGVTSRGEAIERAIALGLLDA